MTDRPDRRYSHPGYVIHTARQVAEVRGVDAKHILRVNRQNVRDLYKV